MALTLVVAFFAWQSVERAIAVESASNWGMPIVFFSLFFILLYLDIILIRRVLVLQLLFLTAFLLSFIFAFNLWHVGIVFLAYLFSLWSIAKIKQDLRLNVKVSIWKSIQAGNFLLLLSVAVVIASQYYSEVKSLSAERLIPRFNVEEMTGGATSKILSTVNPDFKNLEQEDLTVDQYILKKQKDEVQSEAPTGISLEVVNIISAKQEELILREERRRLSVLAGKPLSGNEKIADVFSGIINQKIDQYLGARMADSQKNSPLPFIMAVALFLTVLPLGSLLSTVWIWITKFVIWLFVKKELIYITKVPVEIELIEQ